MTTRAEHLEYVARMAELGEVSDEWIVEQVRIGTARPTAEQEAAEKQAAQLEAKAAQLEAEQKAQEVLKDIDQGDPAQLRLAAKSLREQIQEAPSVLVEKKVETVAPTADPVPEADSPADPSLGEKFVQWLKS